MERQTILALLVVVLAIGLTALVTADPSSPTTLTAGDNQTFNPANYVVQSTTASAGNITALVLTAISQTKAWQGYYGNITGSITLDDANNFTFYNWTSTEPRGQIYATLNSSVTWNMVECENFTNNSAMNESFIEDYYQIPRDAVDGIAETYTATDHPTFTIGARNITGCPTSYIFQSDQPQFANFVDVLLYDSADNSTGWIYTTLIENKTTGSSNDLLCYNGEFCDFQILVNENGFNGDTDTTTYYFWVELI